MLCAAADAHTEADAFAEAHVCPEAHAEADAHAHACAGADLVNSFKAWFVYLAWLRVVGRVSQQPQSEQLQWNIQA